MRVLHIHSGNLYGGVETMLRTLARSRRLSPSMEMAAALSFEGRIADELRAEGVDVTILGAVRLRRPDTIWRARQALTRLMRRERYDVAICHQAWPLTIFGSAVKAAGVPLVSWVHMALTGHWLERLASRVQPDAIICNSQFTMTTVPPTRARVDWVYSPVITSAQPAHARSKDIVIVQVSRMEPLKGQTICLEALGLLRDEPGWTCWQVGGATRPEEARYLDDLKRTAAHLGIADRVQFLGQRFDVPDILAAADVFCQPNVQPEAFGISFVEAMSAGLPVVTSALGGAMEVVNDRCGILTPPGDAGALAQALGRLIRDPEERRRLGSHGPARAQELSDPRRQMGRIASLLEDIACRKAAA